MDTYKKSCLIYRVNFIFSHLTFTEIHLGRSTLIYLNQIIKLQFTFNVTPHYQTQLRILSELLEINNDLMLLK